MRTTIDIDDPILADLKRLQAQEGTSLGRLVSDLLAPALAARKAGRVAKPKARWLAADLGTFRVDLEDRDAVLEVLDAAEGRRPPAALS